MEDHGGTYSQLEQDFIATAVMAVLFVIFGGGIWWFFILGMLLFLVPAALVTWLGREYKRKKKLGQDPGGSAMCWQTARCRWPWPGFIGFP